MSRIGKKTISIPTGVAVEIGNGEISVKGPKGELVYTIPTAVKVIKDSNEIKIESVSSGKNSRKVWGTSRSLVANMIKGVTDGYEKKLEIEGIGYKAQTRGNKLVLGLGFSHPVEMPAPAGITFKVEKNSVIISGADKILVGEVAARIRKLKEPEPYKGKGIRYQGEIVRRKAGKKATTV